MSPTFTLFVGGVADPEPVVRSALAESGHAIYPEGTKLSLGNIELWTAVITAGASLATLVTELLVLRERLKERRPEATLGIRLGTIQITVEEGNREDVLKALSAARKMIDEAAAL